MRNAEAEIRDRIARQGKITFADFMEVALYHPGGGYYADGSAFGAAGDYFTSPTAHPVFGALVAIQLHRMWDALGRPSRFYTVEMGAGSGLLARDVAETVEEMNGDFTHSLRYIAIERYATPAELRDRHSAIEWVVAGGVPLNGVVGCFISNELVDSFPVHRFQVHKGRVKEVYVVLSERGEFVEALSEPSTPMLSERLKDLDLSLPEGFRGEINLAIRPWLEAVSRALERGFLITMDYGYEADELYSSKRSGGTLQTYYRHTEGGSPYQRVGRQDITGHVDFSSVASEGKRLELNPLGLRTQSRFLRDLGFEGMVHRLRAKKLGQRERNANMTAMLELVKPDGLGAFRVLFQEKGTGINDLSGLTPRGESINELDVPLLRPRHIQLMEGSYPHLAQDFDQLWPFGKPGL